VKVADGFRRAVKCHLRRDFGAVLRVRAENATKKGLHGTRKTPLIFALQAPSPFPSRNGACRRSWRQPAGFLVRRAEGRLRANPWFPAPCSKTARFWIGNDAVPSRVSGRERVRQRPRQSRSRSTARTVRPSPPARSKTVPMTARGPSITTSRSKLSGSRQRFPCRGSGAMSSRFQRPASMTT